MLCAASAQEDGVKAWEGTIEMPTYINGGLDLYVEVRLVKTENGWRLDSPTY